MLFQHLDETEKACVMWHIFISLGLGHIWFVFLEAVVYELVTAGGPPCHLVSKSNPPLCSLLHSR